MSRNRKIFLGVVVALAFVLQLAVVPQFRLFGVAPDLLLVVAVAVAIVDGPMEGAVIGLIGGLLQGLIAPQVMGVSAFSKMISAFVAGLLAELVMTSSFLLPVLIIFLVSLFEPVLFQGTMAMLGRESLAPLNFVGVILPTAGYNVLVNFVIFPLVRKFRFIESEESLFVSGKIKKME